MGRESVRLGRLHGVMERVWNVSSRVDSGLWICDPLERGASYPWNRDLCRLNQSAQGPREDFAMKIQIAAAALVLATVPALSQSASTGVSKPDNSPILSDSDQPVSSPAKPSAAVPMVPRPLTAAPATTGGETYGAYVPYAGPAVAATPGTAPVSAAVAGDMDGQIVSSVPEIKGQVREGTLLRVRLVDGLSTLDTVRGSRFAAMLAMPVTKDGIVVLPAGSVMEGMVTAVHSGKRISGAAALHLEPSGVTLPDGTHYAVRAQLIDTGDVPNIRVDREGTLMRHDHPKETLAIIGATTGTAALAGGMIGGGVGAVVGAGIGAGASTIVWLRQDRQAVVPKDSMLIFSLTTPLMLQPAAGPAMSSMPVTGVQPMGQAQ